MSFFDIHTTSQTTKARVGTLNFGRGTVKTPVFMPIATVGSVKSLSIFDLKKLKAQIILGNTYHLWLKPDFLTMQKAGGLHSFMAWDKPILTDSGGFQVFSLSKIRKMNEDGVTFQVPASGQKRHLTPETSINIQNNIGSDVVLPLDEPLAAEVDWFEAKRAMWQTYRWIWRSKIEFDRLKAQFNHDHKIFGIPQGAQFPDLRKQSAELTRDMGFDGYSIGGVANGGEPEEMMYTQVLAQTDILEDYKPRHLLGVGTPKDIVQMVARGIDMFDCVYPTRNARHGNLFFQTDDNSYFQANISAKRFEHDFTPINSNSDFEELRTYTRAYLRHLFCTKELLAYRLATLHNLEFYINLMANIQDKIEVGTFDSWWQEYKEQK